MQDVDVNVLMLAEVKQYWCCCFEQHGGREPMRACCLIQLFIISLSAYYLLKMVMSRDKGRLRIPNFRAVQTDSAGLGDAMLG